MVDYVDQLLPERIGIALAFQVYVSQLFAQELRGERTSAEPSMVALTMVQRNQSKEAAWKETSL